MHARLSDEEYFAEHGYISQTGALVRGPAAFSGAELEDFRDVIAPLEHRAGKPLNGPGLRQCQRAFKENRA
jgi:hypothetical protein